MRILIMEDDARAMPIVDLLRTMGNTVDHTATLPGLSWYLEEEPGIGAYDAVILDLNVPGAVLKRPGNLDVTYNAKMGLNGLQYCFDNYEMLFKPHIGKLAFYSGYLPSAKVFAQEKGCLEWFAEVKYFDKISGGLTGQVHSWLRELPAQSAGRP